MIGTIAFWLLAGATLVLLVGAVVGVAGDAGMALRPRPRLRRPRLVEWREVDHDLILRFDDGATYRGSGTVWHSYPTGQRCGVLTESWLSDVWTRVEWDRRARSGSSS